MGYASGFGEGTPQQAVLKISRKGKSSKRATVATVALLAGLAETTK